jgi:uncharacterized integral membrane protein (TIGR00698 family)
MWLLLVLSVVLQLGFLVLPGLSEWLSPVLAALILGLAAAFLLPYWITSPQQLFAAQLDKLSFFQQKALRVGIVLFAFSVEPELIQHSNPVALAQLMLVVGLVLSSALWLGIKVFKLPKQLVLLVSSGLTFCGTSAIFATWSLRKTDQASLSQSLAVILLMGLLVLSCYAVLMQTGWLTTSQLAWLIGSTAPEVSQAVAAGSQLGEAAPQAVIAKLFRVCLLVPFLVLLALQHKNSKGVVFPWFVLAFLLVLLLKNFVVLSHWLSQVAVLLSQSCLIFAMLVAGLLTRWQELRQCSGKVFGFAALVMLLLFSLVYLCLPV